MKTSKKFFVVLLALVLGIAAFIPSTFSWYSHNGERTGNGMSYQRTDLPISSGQISMTTKRYNTEREHYTALGESGKGDVNKLYYDDKGNKEVGSTVLSDTIASKSSHFYGTTFSNTGSSPAYVNIYLKNFTNNPANYIGTYQPSLTDKSISSTIQLKNKSAIRVYFRWNQVTAGWGAQGAKIYVVSIKADGTKTPTQFDTTNHKLINKPELQNKTTYYADLADNTVSFYFATDAGDSTNNVVTSNSLKAWYRTNTITNIQPCIGYDLNNKADDTTFHAQYDTFDVEGGVSAMTYFSNVIINKNQHANIALKNGTNYTGSSVQYAVTAYSDSQTSIALNNNLTVNANTGFITAKDTLQTGNNIAHITTTITGALGDTMDLDTFVSNPSSVSSATISLNVEVPSGTEANPGAAEVVWYIRNESTTSCSFSSIYYTK